MEKKKVAAKSLWSAIKEAVSEWSFGGSGGLSRLGEFNPSKMPPVKRPKCEICGTNDCISSEEYRKRFVSSRSNSKFLLQSCSVRKQLKDMSNLRVKTSSGKDVYLTRPKRPTPPPAPPPKRTVPSVDNAMVQAHKDIEDRMKSAMEALEAKQDAMTKKLAEKEEELGKRLAKSFNIRRGRTRPPVR